MDFEIWNYFSIHWMSISHRSLRAELNGEEGGREAEFGWETLESIGTIFADSGRLNGRNGRIDTIGREADGQ